MKNLDFNIAAVERDTGISKDVLRVWERRYGFPQPTRDPHGERQYPLAQVGRLRQIKRLMDRGHRPGKLLSLSEAELQALTLEEPGPRKAASPPGGENDFDALLRLVRQHDATGYLEAMQQRLARDGLQRFVLDIVAPMTARVGVAWERGELEIFEEHLFTELTKRLLRQAIATLPAMQQRPRVLLTSVPGEQHVLGLLMVEAMLTLEGTQCIPLGTEMPLLDIARATQAHQADIVALSFAASFPQRQVQAVLLELQRLLPKGVGLWAGGSGASRVAPPRGAQVLASLDEVMAALHDWRAAHDALPAA